MRLCFVLVLLILCCVGATARSISQQHVFSYNAGHHYRRNRWGSHNSGAMVPVLKRQRGAVLLASSTKKRRRKGKEKQEVVPVEPPEAKPVTWDDLGPVSKVFAGAFEIVASTVLEYAQGWIMAYIFGIVTGVPALLFKNTAEQVRFPGEIGARFGRMNARAVGWGQKWAPISAVFGGSNAAVRIARNKVEDDWNIILSSAAAGAYFSRKSGPAAMARSAVLYGGITYLLSGGLSKPNQLEFTQEVDF